MWLSAAFEVLYERNCIGLHLRLAIEEMLMMEPPPWRIMCGTTSRAVSIGPLRLIACTRSQDSSVTSTSSPNSSMPTLWCSTSIRPKRSRASATMRRICALSRTSASKESARPPASRMRRTVSDAAAGERSAQRTVAPSRAKAMAQAAPLLRPWPVEPAPTTIAALPASRRGVMLRCPWCAARRSSRADRRTRAAPSAWSARCAPARAARRCRAGAAAARPPRCRRPRGPRSAR